MVEDNTDNNHSEMPEEERLARWEEFCKYRDKAWDDITASSDDFDKSLLTYASGTLGLSLAFIKDIVKIDSATALPCLYWSWIFLTACIVITIASFRISIEAQKRHLITAQRVFLEDDEEASNKGNAWSTLLDICAYVGATFFLAGVVTTVLFVYLNVLQEHKMGNQKLNEGRTPMVINTSNTFERGRAPMPISQPKSKATSPKASPCNTGTKPIKSSEK
jgi:hypothetical protein